MSSRTAFGIPAFRRLWGAGLISDMGDWLLFIALPLVVFQISGSALGASIAFLLELVPAIVLSPLAAMLAGRFDRRWLMAFVNVGQALALLPLLFVHSAAELPLAYAVILVHASLSTLFEPAKNSLLPDLVDVDRLVSANALIGLNQNLGRLIGAPLGGILLAMGDLGLIVAVDAVTYIVSACLIISLPARPMAPRKPGEPASMGVLAALRIPRLRGAYAVILISSIAQGMFLVLFILFVLGPMGGTDADVGLLRGVQAVGAIGAGIALGLLIRGSSPRALTISSLFFFGAISLITWNLPLLTTQLIPYVVLFAVVGAPGVIMMTGLMSVLQAETTNTQRGAVFAAVGLISAIGQIAGILLSGFADAGLGLVSLLEVQGGLYLAAGVIAFVMLPRHPKTVAGSDASDDSVVASAADEGESGA